MQRKWTCYASAHYFHANRASVRTRKLDSDPLIYLLGYWCYALVFQYRYTSPSRSDT